MPPVPPNRAKTPSHKLSKAAAAVQTAVLSKKIRKQPAAKAAGKAVHTRVATAGPPPSGKVGGDNDDFEDMVVPSDGEDADGGAVIDQQLGQGADQVVKKKKKHKKGLKKSAQQFEASRDLAAQIADASLEVQADWLWESYSAVTAAGYLERDAFREASLVQLANEGSLEDRLRAAEPAWEREFCGEGASEDDRPPGCPSLLFVSPSAVGANDLIKHVPTFNQRRKAAKLFAKHFKVHEQVEVLSKTHPCIASGTPHRLCKLADIGALKLSHLRLLVIDVQLDAKQRTVMDMPETRSDFWEMFRKHLQQRVVDGQTRIALLVADNI